MLSIRQCRPELVQVARAKRIDHSQNVFRNYLDQTQFGSKRVFRDKLGIDPNPLGTRKPPAQIGELGGRSNRLVRHGTTERQNRTPDAKSWRLRNEYAPWDIETVKSNSRREQDQRYT